MMGGRKNEIFHNKVDYIILAIGYHWNQIHDNKISHGHPNSLGGGGILLWGAQFTSVHDNIISDLDNNNYATVGIKIQSDTGFAKGFIGLSSGDSSFNTINNNTISDCDIGILLLSSFLEDSDGNVDPDKAVYSRFNTINENNISNCDVGIYLRGSPKNTLSKNIIKNNAKGINITNLYQQNYTLFAHDNNIYLNDFVDNTQQAYDEGENTWYRPILEEGNYWSDYTSKYPGAQVIHRLLRPDIWSIPYDIDGGTNKDMFPLVNNQHSNSNSNTQSNPSSQTQPGSQPSSQPSIQPSSTTTSTSTPITTISTVTSTATTSKSSLPVSR
jgi:parallel beta-helix repeat protein